MTTSLEIDVNAGLVPPLSGETLIDEPACMRAFAGAALLGAQWRPELLPPQFKNDPVTGAQLFSAYAVETLMAASPADQAAVLRGFYGDCALPPNDVFMTPFPTLSYRNNLFFFIASGLFPLFFVLAMAVPVSQLIRLLVVEKETRMREQLRMMGVTAWATNTAWVLWYVAEMAVCSVLSTIVLHFSVLQKSDFSLVLVVFLLFTTSSIALAFLLSTFFSSSSTAAALGAVLYIAVFFPAFIFNSPNSGDAPQEQAKVAASILGPTGFALTIGEVYAFEAGGTAATWDRVDVEASPGYTISVGLRLMLVTIVLYGVLAAYLDAVIPSEFGTAEPFYFCCLPRFWTNLCRCCCSPSAPAASGIEADRAKAMKSPLNPDAAGGKDGIAASVPRQYGTTSGAASGSTALVEALTGSQRSAVEQDRCVRVQNLRKEFKTPDGIKVAVAGISMDLIQGEISVLLGHNSAGKTTLANMLTGLYTPTSGTASVFGADLQEDLQGIRRNLAFCPQHDILWDDLTVEEHLLFVAGVRGLPSDGVEKEANEQLAAVRLEHRRRNGAGELSGGQRRRLSLAMTFTGNPRFALIDEASSGVDAYARK